ncbi:hypothetical protein AK812_SmicGene32290 [Symbiodinium microadriaticum]|uniref:Uncharacterized protein n=1 Tax=Symbiodinium microadriaticum TaxID=2951 RepID=A0A1Q9CUJ0_SYMMI|nr:hypothetical protein AK812_SmicGene32290 [Symbiodinium microadriaticum]
MAFNMLWLQEVRNTVRQVLEKHLAKLRTVAVLDVPTRGLGHDLLQWSSSKHPVNLIYASAVPVNAYNNETKSSQHLCICGPGKFAPVKRKHDSIENEKTKANEGEGDGKSNVSEPPLTRDQRLHMQLQIEKFAAEARDKKASHQTNVPWSMWKHSHKWWHKELRTICPSLQVLALDPVHLAMTCEYASARKRTASSRQLRLILRKLTADDAEAMAGRWGPVYHGGSPPALNWEEKRARQQLEDRSMRQSDAQKLLADLNPQALLPVGTTSNEARHHEIKTWFRETQKLHQATLRLKLGMLKLGNTLSHNRALYHPTTRQMPEAELVARASASVGWSTEERRAWCQELLNVRMPQKAALPLQQQREAQVRRVQAAALKKPAAAGVAAGMKRKRGRSYQQPVRSDLGLLQRVVSSLLLRGAYYGAMKLALQKATKEWKTRKSSRTRKAVIYLLPLGGGVFNNPFRDIVTAMVEAVHLVSVLCKKAGSDGPSLKDLLTIRILAWEGRPEEADEIRELLQELGQKCHDADGAVEQEEENGDALAEHAEADATASMEVEG